MPRPGSLWKFTDKAPPNGIIFGNYPAGCGFDLHITRPDAVYLFLGQIDLEERIVKYVKPKKIDLMKRIFRESLDYWPHGYEFLSPCGNRIVLFVADFQSSMVKAEKEE